MSDVITPKEEQAPQVLPDTSGEPKTSSVDISMIPLQGFFNITNPTVAEQDALGFVYKYFEGQGYESMQDVLLTLTHIQNELGTPPLGTTQLTHLKNYLKVMSQISDLEKIKMSFRR